MKKGDKGVIFVSFGTVALTKNMPPTFVHNVVDAMRSFPEFHFIFKVDEGDQVKKCWQLFHFMQMIIKMKSPLGNIHPYSWKALLFSPGT